MRLSEIFQTMNYTQFELIRETEFHTMSMLIPNRKETDRCVFILDKKYIKKIDSSVKMVITYKELAHLLEEVNTDVGICVVDDPRLVFYMIHNWLAKQASYCRDVFASTIGNDCNISKLAIVPENNIIIGDNVTIEPGVVLIGHVKIGDNSIIHSGTVIGAQGNDFKRFGDRLERTAQVGAVVIGEGVEIDPNSCIERPTFPYEDTTIGNQTKIGALSFVAHGTVIGDFTQIKGMVNIAGYATIGSNVYIGPGVTISNLISIGDNAHVTIGSVVGNSIKSDSHVTGNFAIDHEQFMANFMKSLR